MWVVRMQLSTGLEKDGEYGRTIGLALFCHYCRIQFSGITASLCRKNTRDAESSVPLLLDLRYGKADRVWETQPIRSGS